MSQQKPRVLVLAGEGIHCEVETAQAFRLAKFETEIRHINDLIREGMSVDYLSGSYSVLALPGGASFGHELGAGKVLALKILYQLKWDLTQYAARGGMVLGICNGFQALIRAGFFGKDISVANNTQGKFIDSWVKVTPSGNRCVWLKGLGSVELPIRHSEGKLVIASSRRVETLDKMNRVGMTCLKYEENPNGSEENLAGLCDLSGRILGLMPHPEAFVRWTAHPDWTAQPGRASAPGQGLVLFENAYREAVHSN